MACPVPCPCSVSSYSTLNPETVSEAETQEITKLLEVISVTDSAMSTMGGGWVVSPCDVATAAGAETENDRVKVAESMTSEMSMAWQKKGFDVSNPEYLWHFKNKTTSFNTLAGADICQQLTRSIGGGKLKAGDLLASKPKKAY